jgi:hypothetical protein
MFSDKVEDIPNQNYRDLETSLSEIRGLKTEYFTRRLLARKSGVDEAKVLVFLTDLCDREILRAKIEVRCPHCDQEHGKYGEKSEIPQSQIPCFCGNEFDPQRREAWNTVYTIEEEETDFFPNLKMGLKQLTESADDLSSDFFTRKFEQIENIEDNRKRGRTFDFFIGLLFNQLESVDVFVGKSVPIGEIDVFVTCLDSPQWLHRLVGDATLIENKWVKDPIQPRQISVFHDKVGSAPINCKLSYFISMSGYTSSGEMSAKQLIRTKQQPKIVGLERPDVIEMKDAGTPRPVLRDRVMR